MRNPCNQEPLLNAYLDGELTEAQAAELKRHLADCPGCRRALETLRHADALVRDLPPLAPSAAFDRTFWEKVDALETGSRYRIWAGQIFRGWRPVWAAVLTGIAVAALIHFGRTDALTTEEVFIAQHIELLEDYDVISQLDMLEEFDAAGSGTVKETS
jgi:anti-sigma factor RsiW